MQRFLPRKPESLLQKYLEHKHVQGIFSKRIMVTVHGNKNKSSEMAIHFRA
jgi:hypothetical protein